MVLDRAYFDAIPMIGRLFGDEGKDAQDESTCLPGNCDIRNKVAFR